MKFSTNRILRTAVAIVILTIATVLFVSIRQSQRVRDTSEAVVRTEELLHHIQSLELSIVDNEAGARGYVITGKPEYLEQVKKSEQDTYYELALLRKKILDPEARHLFNDSLSSYIAKRISFSNQLSSVREREGADSAASLVNTGMGKFYVDEIQRVSDKIEHRENELLEQRKQSNERTISKLSFTLYIVLAAVFILSMLIIRRVRLDVRYILQKRKREEELRKSEERFRLLVNNVKDYAIFMIDTEGNVASWNSGAEHIKGYTSEEVIGRSIEIFYKETDRQRGEPRRNLEMARKLGHYEKEGWRLRKDGSVFLANVVISALFDQDGNLQGYAKVTRDITEKKASEEQLLFLSRQVNQSNDAIYTTDADRKIKSWNRGAENLYGFTTDEVIGCDPNELLKTVITDEQIDVLLKDLENYGYWAGELIRKNKSGEDLYIRSSTTTIKDIDGNITGYVTVNLDITERKNLEEKLRKFNEELEEQVEQKTAELTGIFERVTDAFIAIDNDFQYRYVNKKAGEMIRRDPVALIGKKVLDEYPYLVNTDLYKGFLTAMSSQQLVIVSEYYQEIDLWLENYIYPSEDGLSIFIRDISEAKRTEKQLQTAHKRLLFHVENSPLGFIEWDNELRVKSWSHRAQEIFGWTEKELLENLDGNNADINDSDMPKIELIARQLVSGESERNVIEHRNYTKDGAVIWCEWYNSVIKDEQGKVITILSLVQDITERKKAEVEIKKSFVEKRAMAERMATILNTLPANIALLDEQGIIMDLNEAWKTCGYSNGLIDKNHHIGTDYLAVALGSKDSNGKTVAKGILSVLSGRLSEFTFEYSHEFTGDNRWFRMIVTPLQQANQTGAVIMHIDITQQKRNEEELRLSEQKYKLLFESNPMPMWMRSLSSKEMIDVNKAACAEFGYSKDEFLALLPTDLRHPDENEFMHEFEQEFPSPTNRGVWKYRKKDGQYMDAEIFVQDIIYNRQKVRLVLAKDMTETLKAQEKLRHSYEEIRSLASHLQNVREEERKIMSREIHDQLGQQLAVMKMDVSWLYKKITTTDKSVRDKMEELKDITDDTVNLVRRISSDLRPGLLDDMGLLAAIEWHLEEFEKRSGIETELNSIEEEPKMSAEAKTNLYRIVQESLTNVSRYAKAKKVLVNIEIRNQKLILVIQDNGTGFDKGRIAAKKTLGILGMRERTVMLGGNYELITAPGQGTTVIVTIPL